ncbi:hypothetical protein [Paractinoplanes lichenicola]|uniref:Uncharacterized protein n=1 Tax=Paractinoplanes lichenicola TaxID=2802976 RepID=A0ABS1VIW5_9ACTN|nr:hypothetical protein [Actinoplanes lichenicola]MBL7254436.1 hypothetical protein [Actinoplanes lichenicola]
MTRRWSGVVLLTVVTLAIYLITPDRLPAAHQPHPPPAGGQGWSAGNAHDPAGHPQVASDGVTMLPRVAATELALQTPAVSSLASAEPFRWRLGEGLAGRAVLAWQPDLHALKILRC